MKISKEYKVFQQIAVKEGVPVEQVRKEIETAIEIGLSNPDPEVQKIWSSIPCKSNKPTPEELVRYLSRNVYNKSLNDILGKLNTQS